MSSSQSLDLGVGGGWSRHRHESCWESEGLVFAGRARTMGFSGGIVAE